MSALDEITTLLESMKSRRGEMVAFEGLLKEIGASLAEIVEIMDKPSKDGDGGIAQAITDGFKGLSLASPTVQVTVPEPSIVFMPAAASEQKQTGWKLKITSRDGNGAIREISFQPE